MKIVVLKTDLFPEKAVLEASLEQLGSDHEISRYDTNAELSDSDWDSVVQEIVSADRILTL